MVYLAERAADEYGFLDVEDEWFSTDPALFDWFKRYPKCEERLNFTWTPGEYGDQPNFYWYPEVPDWVCDIKAYDLLMTHAPGDVHLIAEGELVGKPMYVVQVVGLLDIVDYEASVVEHFASYDALGFPSMYSKDRMGAARRVFRVPQSVTDLFMGDEIVKAVQSSGLTGLKFVAVDWS